MLVSVLPNETGDGELVRRLRRSSGRDVVDGLQARGSDGARAIRGDVALGLDRSLEHREVTVRVRERHRRVD